MSNYRRGRIFELKAKHTDWKVKEKKNAQIHNSRGNEKCGTLQYIELVCALMGCCEKRELRKKTNQRRRHQDSKITEATASIKPKNITRAHRPIREIKKKRTESKRENERKKKQTPNENNRQTKWRQQNKMKKENNDNERYAMLCQAYLFQKKKFVLIALFWVQQTNREYITARWVSWGTRHK